MPRDEEPNGTVISALEGRQRPFLLPYVSSTVRQPIRKPLLVRKKQ